MTGQHMSPRSRQLANVLPPSPSPTKQKWPLSHGTPGQSRGQGGPVVGVTVAQSPRSLISKEPPHVSPRVKVTPCSVTSLSLRSSTKLRAKPRPPLPGETRNNSVA